MMIWYRDPDETTAENLTRAIYYLYEANQTDAAEKLTDTLCQLFGDVPIEKKKNAKTIGDVIYYAAGLIIMPPRNGIREIKIPAPVYKCSEASDEEQDLINAKQLKAKVNKDIRRDWFTTRQITAAIDGKDVPRIQDLSPLKTLTAIQKAANAMQSCDEPDVLETLYGKIVDAIRENKTILNNPFRYYTAPLARKLHMFGDWDPEYKEIYERVSYEKIHNKRIMCGITYYEQKAIEELQEAIPTHKTVSAIDYILSKYRKRCISWATWAPYYDGKETKNAITRLKAEIIAITNDIKTEQISSDVAYELANEVIKIIGVTLELQQAYHAFSTAQDDYIKSVFAKAGVIDPNVMFDENIILQTALAAAKKVCRVNRIKSVSKESTGKILEQLEPVLVKYI